MNSLLQEFTNFTKEDWQEFERIKSLAFEPTQEELEAQRLEQENQKKLVIENKLNALGLTRPETITKEFALGLLNMINAKEFVGDNIEEWIEAQIILFGDIETAFDDLVYSRL